MKGIPEGSWRSRQAVDDQPADETRYRSFAQAERDGYTITVGEPCVRSPFGTMGVQAANAALRARCRATTRRCPSITTCTWVAEDNPSRIFAQFNPTPSCP